MNDDPELLSLEREADSLENTLALRVLYGFLTYLDNLEVASPAGTYCNFLAGMDAAVRRRLSPGHVYEFVERLTETGGAQHCFFLLLDQFNAVKSEGEVGPLTWAGVSGHDKPCLSAGLPSNPCKGGSNACI